MCTNKQLSNCIPSLPNITKKLNTRAKKKEKEGFSIEDQKEVKIEKIGGEQSNSRSMKEREWKIFRPDKFSAK